MQVSFSANNIKVWHKGLILVLVPVLLEVAFLVALTASLQRAEYAAWKASHSQALVSEANKLTLLIYQSGLSLFYYAATKNPFFAEQYSEAVGKAPEHIRLLKNLALVGNRKTESLERIDKLNNWLSDLTSEVKNSLDAENQRALMAYDWKVEIGRQLHELIKELQNYSKSEAEIERVDFDAQDRARNLVIACLAIGVVINLVLAVALVYFFSKGIVRRIRVMIDNTKKIAESEPLNPIVDGSDEIAELDQFTHKMADALKVSEEKRNELMAMVGHDLRSPIAAVNGATKLMLVGAVGSFDENVKGELEKVERNTRRLIDLINDLLDVEKIAAGKLKLICSPVNVDDIFEDTLIALKGFGDAKRLKLEAAQTGLTVYAEADRLVQVLVNLCSNAIKFSPEGGSVLIDATAGDGFVEFSVADQGPGISEDLKDRLFGRFEQSSADSKSKRGSSGLGLSICKSLVELHGGTIGVESELGKGSTFWFKIPHAVAVNNGHA